MSRCAIFLDGPIGAGKTTLGRALAARLSGRLIDGDDLSDPNTPWYGSMLRTSRAMVRAAVSALEAVDVVVVAYPLGCTNWIYFRRKMAEAGVAPIFVSLRASFASIVDPGRGRTFSREERARIEIMIAEGYGARPFSDLVIDTDRADFAATLDRLEADTRRLIAS